MRDAVDEVLCVFFANALDSKVADDERKRDGVSVMVEKAGDVGDLAVLCSDNVCNEAFVGEDSGLWEAVHLFAD